MDVYESNSFYVKVKQTASMATNPSNPDSYEAIVGKQLQIKIKQDHAIGVMGFRPIHVFLLSIYLNTPHNFKKVNNVTIIKMSLNKEYVIKNEERKKETEITKRELNKSFFSLSFIIRDHIYIYIGVFINTLISTSIMIHLYGNSHFSMNYL